MFSIATKKGGKIMGFPNVCKVPAPPAPPIPTPFPSIGDCKDADSGTCAKKVKIKKKKVLIDGSKIKRTKGDEPGTLKGMMSQKQGGEGKPKTKSSKTKEKGKGVIYQTCMFGQNGSNANMPACVLTTVSESKGKTTM
jgi:hypothetical protein